MEELRKKENEQKERRSRRRRMSFKRETKQEANTYFVSHFSCSSCEPQETKRMSLSVMIRKQECLGDTLWCTGKMLRELRVARSSCNTQQEQREAVIRGVQGRCQTESNKTGPSEMMMLMASE